LVLAVGIACVIYAHVRISQPLVFVNEKDEGYLAAFVQRMLAGRFLPFADAVSHRGPVYYWLSGLVIALRPSAPLLMLRVLSGVAWVVAMVLAVMAARPKEHRLAGLTGALAIPIASLGLLEVYDGIAWNAEHLLNVFALGAFVAMQRGLGGPDDAPRLRLVAVSGGLGMAAALCKQVGLVELIPIAIGVACAASRPALTESRPRLIRAFALGAAAPAALVLLLYAAAGQLSALWFGLFGYNRIYMSPFTFATGLSALLGWCGDSLSLLGLGVLAALALASTLLSATRLRDVPRVWDAHRFEATVAAQAMLSLASANSTLRFWGHYYVQAAPWFGLLLGLLLERVVVGPVPDVARRRDIVRAWTALLPTLLVVFATSRFVDHFRSTLRRQEPNMLVCAPVDFYSKPDDTLFIWGFASEYYTLCKRQPASRYVYTTFLAGFVPWFENATPADETARIPAGAQTTLITDLEGAKVPVIVDLGAETLFGRTMSRQPALATYLQEHYCPAPGWEDLTVYARRRPDGACPPARRLPNGQLPEEEEDEEDDEEE
jgi:hypothetical protein